MKHRFLDLKMNVYAPWQCYWWQNGSAFSLGERKESEDGIKEKWQQMEKRGRANESEMYIQDF